MSDEQDKLKLSLEPPKLFGRKKKPATPAGASAPAQPARPAAAAPVEEPVVEEPVVEEPVVEEPVVEEPVAEEPVAEEPVAEEPVDEEPTAVLEPVVEPEPEPVASVPAPKKKSAPRATPKPTRPVEVDVEPEPVSATDLEDAEIAAMGTGGALLTAYRAAALTGLVVGAAMVVLTALSLRGCEAVRGTSSCGGGPGFVLLVATFAVCVLLGSALLKTFQIPDPGSSSFLAVGLVAVVALLFLIDVLDHWSMIIVIPVLSIGGYLASVWVTKTFVEPVDT